MTCFYPELNSKTSDWFCPAQAVLRRGALFSKLQCLSGAARVAPAAQKVKPCSHRNTVIVEP